MKLQSFIVLIAFVAITQAACKKQEIETTPLASLQITNAVLGGSELQFGSNVTTIAGNSVSAYGVLTGKRQVKLVSKDAANSVYYDKTHDFVNGGVYSLFLGGTPADVEPVFVKEEHIVPHTDNVFGVRVINLSSGTRSVSVNLSGSSSSSLVPDLAYKGISDFKTVSAVAEEGDKTFVFRNADSGELIASCIFPVLYNRLA